MNERQKFEGEKIALVAHGGVLECDYREAMNLPLNVERTITIYNASINRFVYQDGQLSLVSWGDIEHLGDQAPNELAEDTK